MSTNYEKNLEKIPHLSFSKLSLFSKNLNGFRQRYLMDNPKKIEGDALDLGSLIDVILFTPEKFNDRFLIGKPPVVTGKMGAFIETYSLLKNAQKKALGPQMNFIETTDEDLMLEAYKEADYKIDIKTVKQEFRDPKNLAYFNYCNIINEGASTKTYVSQEMVDKARNIVRALCTNTFTKDWYKQKGFPQLEIIWRDDMFPKPILSILDLLSFDHEKKIIYVDDLKSTEKPIINFHESIEEYRYDLQAALYRKAVTYLMLNDVTLFKQYKDIKNYRIVNRIVAIETYAPYKSLIVEITDESIYRAELEINRIVSDLHWHLQEDIWDFPRYIYEKNGVIKY